jgi:hypothetical protein
MSYLDKQDDPLRDAQFVAAESAALAKSNIALMSRLDMLNEQLNEKAERQEVKSTRATAIWSLIINFAHIAVTLLAVVFGFGYVNAQNGIKALAECTSVQFDIQQTNTNLLRDAATKERNALRALVDAVANPSASVADRQKSFLTYQASLHAADVQRLAIQPVQRCNH